MIIARSHTRFLTFLTSLLLFIVISILTYRHQGFLHTLTQIDYSIARAVVPNWLENLIRPAYIFSHGILSGLLIFVIAFFCGDLSLKFSNLDFINQLKWLVINQHSFTIFNLEVNGTKIVYPHTYNFFYDLVNLLHITHYYP